MIKRLAKLFSLLLILNMVPAAPAQAASLYNFSSFTFTSGGISGNTGPTLAQALSSYNTMANPWLNNPSYFSDSGGVQVWTVPLTGIYIITAFGAQGQYASDTSGGRGAIIQGTFSLTQGSKLDILVGETASVGTGRAGLSSPGGGGTFVVKDGGTTNADIYVVAGGGGGTSTIARNANSDAVADSTTARSSAGAGGVAGNGGSQPSNSNGGGGGFFTGRIGGNEGGASYLAGGAGGVVNSTYAPTGGGFGGGGSPNNGAYNRYSGGGGYSGGGASSTCGSTTTDTCYGGGGSSYNSGINQINSVGNLGSGKVFIQLVLNPSTLSLAATSALIFRQSSTIQATTSQDGSVTFYSNGKYIPGCRNIATISLVATCTFKPSIHGSLNISAQLSPSVGGYANSTGTLSGVGVTARSSKR